MNATNFNIRYYPLNQHAHELIADGGLGEVRLVTGRYFQDWLLLESDWNWRLQPDRGGALRAVGDIGSHWLDLMTFVTGQHVSEVMADLSTFIGTRHEPTGPVETFSTARSAETLEREISTEDTASILLRFDGGARGAVSISQISPGRKNSLVYEIDGSDGAWGWDSEQPDQAWAGHRERPNEILIRNPALMGAAGQAASSLPAGHVEGFFDTFCAHFRAVYADVVAGAPSSCPSYPTFADGHDEMLVGDAIARSAREGRWVEVDRSGTRRHPGPRHLGARPMRLGLLTAPFPETPLSEVVDWTAANGFESIEIACWPRSSGPTRRYAGTSHIDVANLSASQATEIVDEIRGKGLTISGLGYYPNPLHPDPAHRETVIGHLKHVITAAEKMNVPFVNTFMGADAAKTQDANWQEALKVWPDIVAFAKDHGRQITIENCPMLFSDDEWPGGHNLATTPRIWRRILEEWGGTIGLNFDPSHLILQMIDIPRFIREFGPHILHVQAKDLTIDREAPLRARRLLARDRLADPAPARARRRRVGSRCSPPCGGPATTAT